MSAATFFLQEAIRRIESGQDEIARDVANLIAPRVKSCPVTTRGPEVVINRGPHRLTFLSDKWTQDVERQVDESLARLGGGK